MRALVRAASEVRELPPRPAGLGQPPRADGDPRAGVAGAEDAATLPRGARGCRRRAAIVPGDPSSSTGGMSGATPRAPALGRLTMVRTYRARTASRPRAAAPMTAFLCAFSARLSRTCSGVSPFPSMRPSCTGSRA